MTDNGTTDISQLPSSNGTGKPVQNALDEQNTENIKMENYGEELNSQREVPPAVQQIDYTTQLSNSIKDIGNGQPIGLPSRDIPQNTNQIQQDNRVRVNYIPEAEAKYIENMETRETIISSHQEKEASSNKTDELYEQIQMPILIGIIYFIFQLPIIRKNMLTFIPSLFNKDGNPNLSGYIFNSVVFGLLYYVMQIGIKYIAEF
jgi:hypothetical protein